MKTTEEKVALLEHFDTALAQWFSGKQEAGARAALRKTINEMAPTAQALVKEARCNKVITLTPPPMIGGPVIQNADPFDMIFENYFSMSLIPTVRDMTQQAIGVFRSGRLEEMKKQPPREEAVIYKKLAAPEKVTLAWLAHHVPVSLWITAGGVVLAAFALGLKASAWTIFKEFFDAP